MRPMTDLLRRTVECDSYIASGEVSNQLLRQRGQTNASVFLMLPDRCVCADLDLFHNHACSSAVLTSDIRTDDVDVLIWHIDKARVCVDQALVCQLQAHQRVSARANM